MDLESLLAEIMAANLNAQNIADGLLAHALELDQNRPIDDISVVAVQVLPKQGDDVRRLTVRLPIP
ncbi:MAG: hypothetical protein FVQ83_01955 [Chloroflexi bacterium]|nr:hypothetical protein [Chloroflexota bacterium]